MIDDIPTHIMDAARECHNRIMAQSEGVGLTEARAVYNIAQTIMAQRFSERLQELEGQIHVPGSWHCPKCKFTLQQMVMSAQDCSVAPQDKPGEPCPNCQSPLWRVTWKQDALEMAERAEEQLNARVSLETQLAAATKKLADLFNENGTPRFNAVCERAERAEAKLTAIDTALSAGRFIAIRKILRSQASDLATLTDEGTKMEPTATKLLNKLAEVSAAVGFGAGEPATEIAGHFVSFLAANPVHIERFMRDGHEMVIDGTFTYDQGNLTYRAVDGTIRHPDELRAANAEKKANG